MPKMAGANIALNRELDLPGLSSVEATGLWSVICGGPGMKDCKPTGNIITLNGSHDAMLARGMVPKVCVLLDSGINIVDLITPHKDVYYLVASQCRSEVFQKLKDYKVIKWHAQSNQDFHFMPWETPQIPGGGTTALRIPSIGYQIGVRDFEFFGLDSSTVNGFHHGYDSPHTLGKPTPDHCYVEYDGWDGVRKFKTTLPMIVQAQDFIELTPMWEDVSVNVTVHGEGLIPYIWKTRQSTKVLSELFLYNAEINRRYKITVDKLA